MQAKNTHQSLAIAVQHQICKIRLESVGTFVQTKNVGVCLWTGSISPIVAGTHHGHSEYNGCDGHQPHQPPSSWSRYCLKLEYNPHQLYSLFLPLLQLTLCAQTHPGGSELVHASSFPLNINQNIKARSLCTPLQPTHAIITYIVAYFSL